MLPEYSHQPVHRRADLFSDLRAELFSVLKKAVRDFNYDKVRVIAELLGEENEEFRKHILTWASQIPETTDCLIRAGLEATVLWLIEQGAAEFSENSLIHAVRANLEQVTRYLLKSRAICNPVSATGETVLHIAIQNQNHGILKLLLWRYRRLIDRSDGEGRTPLELACELRDKESVSLLSDAGASPYNLTNPEAILMYAILTNNAVLVERVITEMKTSEQTAFPRATKTPSIEHLDVNVLLKLLRKTPDESGGDIRLLNYENRFLIAALKASADEVVKILLREGFDIYYLRPFIYEPPHRMDQDLWSKLVEIVSELSPTDLSLYTVTSLLRSALISRNEERIGVLFSKFRECLKLYSAQISTLQEFLITVCEKMACFKTLSHQVHELIIEVLREQPSYSSSLAWIEKVIKKLRVNNLSLVLRLLEDKRLASFFQTSTFLNLLSDALAKEEFDTVERVITACPSHLKIGLFNMINDDLLSFAVAKDRLSLDLLHRVLRGLSIVSLARFSTVKEIEQQLVWLLRFASPGNSNYFQQRLNTIKEKAKANKQRANLLLRENERGLQLIACLIIRSLVVCGHLLRKVDLHFFGPRQILDCALTLILNSIEIF
ncbi:MAG: ankyrin repeat domain-containing protein [Deltaproteobacteria bacterium]|nr:ankyrin repeat domain-containing protein [Deltaproteobacteria bacterium]